MTITRITDHVERGLDRLIQQYRNQPFVRAFLTIYLRRIQEIEDANYEVIEKRTLALGAGAILDAIGKIVGASRGGSSDEDFLIQIKARIAILRSDGTPVDLQSLALLCLPPGYTFEYEEGDLAVQFSINEDVAFTPEVLHEVLTDAKAGGVKLLFGFSHDPPGEWLVMGGSPGPRGWGHSGNPAVGGKATCLLGPGESPGTGPGRPAGALRAFGADAVQTEPSETYGIAPKERKEDEIAYVLSRFAAFQKAHDGFEVLNWTRGATIVTADPILWTSTRSQNVIAWDPFHRRMVMGARDQSDSTQGVLYSFANDGEGVRWFQEEHMADDLPDPPDYNDWAVACSDSGVTIAWVNHGLLGNGKLFFKGEDPLYPIPNGPWTEGSPPATFSPHACAWDQSEERFYIVGANVVGGVPEAWTFTEDDQWTEVELQVTTGTALRGVIVTPAAKVAYRADALFVTPNATTLADRLLVADLWEGETALVGMTWSETDRYFVAMTERCLYVSPNARAWQKALTLEEGRTFCGLIEAARLGGIAALGGAVVALTCVEHADETKSYELAVGLDCLREWHYVPVPFAATDGESNMVQALERVGDRLVLVRGFIAILGVAFSRRVQS